MKTELLKTDLKKIDMKIPLPCGKSGALMSRTGSRLILFLILLIGVQDLWAEGSKDFVNYPGHRLFLDTRDPQQLKVYANAGEFINVGASHTGLNQGFIRVYKPDGSVAITFDNFGANLGLAIIDDHIEEANGPTGSANGGYDPGVVEVQPGEEGIWTVIFDFPTYDQATFANILNADPWNRLGDQPATRTVVLAWDITVSQNFPGDQGGDLLTGRVYSNEYISLLHGNLVTTSPTFYVFTQDGYLYQVNFDETDPYRFPISSNSLGLVTSDFTPIYKSKDEVSFRRDDDPGSWDPHPDSLYLYEPQAEDIGPLINNKIFFSPPNPDMPDVAMTTDIWRSPANTHETWLYTELLEFELDTIYFRGFDPDGIGCINNSMELGQGGWFVFNTNIGGQLELNLDLNENNIFDDPEDVTLNTFIDGGLDSIFWDGKTGTGDSIAIQDAFNLSYRGVIQYGEIHISMTDIENNNGGVTFLLVDAPPNVIDDEFYYDHSDIGGDVSGGGTPGNALPTTLPFTYSMDFGNDRFMDQWFFTEHGIDTMTIVVEVINDCPCDADGAEPELEVLSGAGEYCEGDDVIMTATNSQNDFSEITYTWVGPNGYFFQETLSDPLDTSTALINNITESMEGDYSVSVVNELGCEDGPDTISVIVLPNPNITNLSDDIDICEGEDIVLTAMNTVPGIDSITYTWNGPNGITFTNTVGGNDPFDFTIPNATLDNGGVYSISIISNEGCSPLGLAAVQVVVNANPVLVNLTGGGDFCEGDSTILSGQNSIPGLGSVNYSWTGPNGFFAPGTADGDDDFVVTISNLTFSNSGPYVLNVETVAGCSATSDTVFIEVNPNPDISPITGGGDYCVGETITLSATNSVPGIDSITYTWIGPGAFSFTNTVGATDPFIVTIPDANLSNSGTYILAVLTENGCTVTPQSVDVLVNPVPAITGITEGLFCENTDVTLTATNAVPGSTVCSYTWTGPNGFFFTGTADGDGPYPVTITNISSTDAGDYILTLECDGGCTSEPDTATIEVTNGLDLMLLTDDGNYCEGADVTLSATNNVGVDTIIYTWTGPGGYVFTDTTDFDGPFITTINNISVSQSGDYQISIFSPNGCTAEPDTVNVTVFEQLEIINLSGGGSYCEGDSVVLSASNNVPIDTVIYTWTGPNGFIFTDTTDSDGPFTLVLTDVTIDQSGFYVLDIYTTIGCNANPDSVLVEINSNPVIVNQTADTTVCSGDDLLLTAMNSTPGLNLITYTWIAPDGTVFSQTTAGDGDFDWLLDDIQVTDAGTYTLVLESDDGCLSDSVSVDVMVNPSPQIENLTGGGVYCEGSDEEIVLSGTNSTTGIASITYTWEGPGGVIVSETTTNIAGPFETTLNTSTLIPGVYTLTLVSDLGCSDSESVTIDLNNQPEITDITQDTIVCELTNLTLVGYDNNTTSTDSVNYVWTNPDGLIIQSGSCPAAGPFELTIFGVTMADAGEYCLTLTSTEGCVSEVECVEVSILPTPVLEIVAGADSLYCEGEDLCITFVNITPGIDSLYFTCMLPDGTLIVNMAGANDTLKFLLPDLTVDHTGTISCSSESFDGCISSLISFDIEVQPNPEIIDISQDSTYCEGETIVLTASNAVDGIGPIIYTWSSANSYTFTDTVDVFGPFEATIPNATVDMSGTYCLTLESSAGCLSETICVDVVVNPLPIAELTGAGVYCEGDSAVIVATILLNGNTSVTYNLSGPGLSDTGTITTDTTITHGVVVTTTSAGTYSLDVTSDQGCEAVAQSATVEINQIDQPVLEVAPDPICEGETITLTTTDYQGQDVFYEWFHDGSSLGMTDVPTLEVENASAGEYSVLVFVDGCESEVSASVSLTVFPAPDANDDNYTTPFNNPISGENILDNDQTGDGVTLTVISGPSNGTAVVNSDGSFTYTPNPYFAGMDQIVYEICDEICPENCDQAVVNIEVLDVDCNIPNVISPNGDGANDQFHVDCIENNAFPDNVVRIFNRWGDEIYLAEPYTNDWSGTHEDKPLPAGTYFYLIQLRSDRDEYLQGYITIVR